MSKVLTFPVPVQKVTKVPLVHLQQIINMKQMGWTEDQIRMELDGADA